MERRPEHLPSRRRITRRVLHRAVSVVIFDGDNRTLLQRRAPGTYHFANRWSNTCCTHPRSGEDPLAAARRRLTEEMGMTLELTEVGIFLYRAEDPVSGLVENEYDHVFVGTFTGTPRPNGRVVSDWAWASNATLQSRITGHPNSSYPLAADRVRDRPGDIGSTEPRWQVTRPYE